jgi:sterol desaturase/sphingolipid hydroxylase (fatty acid hydroxylase superfamily)
MSTHSANAEADFLASRDDEETYRRLNARMFRSGFVEFFSKVHPVVPAILFVPVVAYFAWRGVGLSGVLATVLAFGGGLLFWTFTEYTLHRFFFHMPKTNAVSRFLYFYSHGIHHSYPDDFYRLVMVPAVSVPLAFLFYGLFHAVLPVGLAAGAFAGMVTGYLLYDYVHFATHHVTPPRAAWLKPIADIMKGQRKRHMRHHFADHDRGYGVSTSLWDHVFRTHDAASDR